MSKKCYTRHTQPCGFEGCDQARRYKVYCPAHYQQWITGKPLAPLHQNRRRNGEPPRMDCREVPCPNPALPGPCLIWIHSKCSAGYGTAGLNGKTIATHRYAWEQANGPIPKGLVIDHQCRNRACCNPAHLRLVTQTINSLENSMGQGAKNAAKTHCFRGHPFDENNTKCYQRSDGRIIRFCLACRVIYNEERRKCESSTANR